MPSTRAVLESIATSARAAGAASSDARQAARTSESVRIDRCTGGIVMPRRRAHRVPAARRSARVFVQLGRLERPRQREVGDLFPAGLAEDEVVAPGELLVGGDRLR